MLVVVAMAAVGAALLVPVVVLKWWKQGKGSGDGGASSRDKRWRWGGASGANWRGWLVPSQPPQLALARAVVMAAVACLW
ncbi:hypothetical protein L3X38_001690 [Prunus dulcis]|uniref:Uncharacterized protein n=1 Tax=Prunus dulcis TaxID=3755 RepID=A0AAD4ZKK3_PRUDU|nr:hypothetical protein L3X38_001690 [Prunus dulcis]